LKPLACAVSISPGSISVVTITNACAISDYVATLGGQKRKTRIWSLSRIALRDRRHRLPNVVDQPKNLAVVAKRVQVAGICGDLNDVPCHVFSCLGVCSPGHGAASSSGIERPATADGIAFAHQIIFRTFVHPGSFKRA
jgi:hypothetical protein